MPRVLVVLTERGYEDYTQRALASLHNAVEVVVLRDEDANLTKLWNGAYLLAKDYDFLVISNNDVIFGKDWLGRLVEGIDGYDVAGPVTNAPGHCAAQDVRKYLDIYIPGDDQAMLDEVVSRLRGQAPVEYHRLNGFCMMFRIAALREMAGDGKPFNENMPLYGAEDEFFNKYKPHTVIVPKSFVFHYKSVTVPRKGAKSQQFRRTNA